MRNRVIGLMVGVIAVLGLWHAGRASTAKQSGVAKAQTAGSIPDLTGVWMERKFQPKMYLNGDPPLLPWAEAKFKAINVTTDDPNLDCLPEGVPRVMFIPLPMEIIQIPGRVLMVQEAWSQWRRIYTDGRQHPKDLDATFMCHSIGKYEGDTLVETWTAQQLYDLKPDWEIAEFVCDNNKYASKKK